MSKVYPFPALRPKSAFVQQIQCPPYDVISSDEARELVKGNPISFLHVVKPEVDLPEDIDLYDERVYQKGKENFERLINDGYLIKEDKPCFYIYEQFMGDHHQVGIVVGASVDEYQQGLIKKHELTRADKEEDRTKHVYTLNANTGPVFLTYKSIKQIDDFIIGLTKKYPVLYDIEAEGVRHIIYRVDEDEDIKKITELFEQVPALYIADGHHRAASGARARELKKAENPNHTGEEEYNRFLAVIFPHNQLKILDYNRVVKDLNGYSEESFISKSEENFDVIEKAEQYKPERVHSFGMYLNGKWYKLDAKPHIISDDPVKGLDVSILQDYVLEPLLGIENPRKDKRIDFIGGIRGLGEIEKLVDSGEYQIGFALYPTQIEQLLAVADAGMIMPPKSTWFEPKLRSGLLIHLLD